MWSHSKISKFKLSHAKTDKKVMRSLIGVIFSLITLVSAQAFPDITELKGKIDGTLAPKTNGQCSVESGPKDLTSVEEVSLNSCFSEYNSAKVKGTSVTLGTFKCELPMDFIIYCSKKDWEKKDYRNIKVKGLDISFSNTKSSAHIPPRGWTNKIALDKYEEEVQNGPEAELIGISCYSGEKMMTLDDFKRIFEDTIQFK